MAFLSREELKLYLAVVFGVALLAILGVVVYAFFFAPESQAQVHDPQTGTERGGGDDFSFSQSDFFVPESFRRLREPEWEPLRGKPSPWTEAEIEKYWVEPVELIEEYLEEENKKIIEDFFSEIP